MKQFFFSQASSSLPRRDFIKTGLITGALAMTGTVSSCSNNSNPPQNPAATIPGFRLDELSLAELQQKIVQGEYTAQNLVELYKQRIAEIDKSGANLNAVIELNPNALSIAAKLDAERQQGKSRSPLHGIPVLLKDNIDTADAMLTTAGSLALAQNRAQKDAFLVRKLRDAGVIILGKTNLSEWANFRSTRSTSGWSGRGGQTRNPYILDRNPCGSSSGSAVAVSANLCAAAVGTETDGSIVCPSHINGIVGIKPTLGLISRSGIIPIAHSQDTAGPMARTVYDAALLLSVLAGQDPADNATLNKQHPGKLDYTHFLDEKGLHGARIGIARNMFGFHDRVDKVIEEAIYVLKHNGAVIIDPANIETAGQFNETEFTVLLYEFKVDLNRYLAQAGAGVSRRTLQDLIAFNEENQATEMPFFNQDIFIMAQEKGDLKKPEYLQALQNNHTLARKKGIDAVMNQYHLDALIAPSGAPAWLTDHVNGDHYMGGSSTTPAVAGYPNITVPAGFVFGLPVGLSFMGRAWSEPVLLRIAFAFEQATKSRKPPLFLKYAEI
ncbi:MAG TPA: amidase [bacterium]|nr:amidase [bacterium]HPN43502.1 amidase [bacterium]